MDNGDTGGREESGLPPVEGAEVCQFSEFRADSLRIQCEQLQNFASALSAGSLVQRSLDLLPDILVEAQALGITRAMIAQSCQVTEGTISRWQSGHVQPHFLMAQTVVHVLARVALSEASALRESGYQRRRKK